MVYVCTVAGLSLQAWKHVANYGGATGRLASLNKTWAPLKTIFVKFWGGSLKFRQFAIYVMHLCCAFSPYGPYVK